MNKRDFEMMADAIEVHAPDGEVHTIAVPSDWGMHDVITARHMMEAAGYQVAVPQTDALFAYAPE